MSKYKDEEVREEKIDYSDILEWFKAQGKGYQTRINAILRSYMENHKKNAS